MSLILESFHSNFNLTEKFIRPILTHFLLQLRFETLNIHLKNSISNFSPILFSRMVSSRISKHDIKMKYIRGISTIEQTNKSKLYFN